MSVDGFARTAAISETPRRIGHLGASREQEHASTCQTPAADISDLVHPDQAHDTSAVGPGASRSFERLASAPGAIGVDGRSAIVQNAERPGGNRGELEVKPIGSGGQPGNRTSLSLFSHKALQAVNAGGMSMTTLYHLAASLARPVARGWLSLDTAEDSLAVHTDRARRRGKLGPYDPDFVFKMACWTLEQRLKSEHARRDVARGRIRYKLKDLLPTSKPSRALLAEAHGVNGDADFPLTEDEVTNIVRTEVYWALPPAPRGGRRYG